MDRLKKEPGSALWPLAIKAFAVPQHLPGEEAIPRFMERDAESQEESEKCIRQDDFGPIDFDNVALSSLGLASDPDYEPTLEPVLLKGTFLSLGKSSRWLRLSHALWRSE